MTDLNRVEYLYNLILPIVVDRKKVTVKTALFSVDFFRDEVYHLSTDDVKAESESFCSLFELVKHSIAKSTLHEDIKIFVEGDLFAIIKD